MPIPADALICRANEDVAAGTMFFDRGKWALRLADKFAVWLTGNQAGLRFSCDRTEVLSITQAYYWEAHVDPEQASLDVDRDRKSAISITTAGPAIWAIASEAMLPYALSGTVVDGYESGRIGLGVYFRAWSAELIEAESGRHVGTLCLVKPQSVVESLRI